MDPNSEVVSLANELARAIEVILNPATPPESRQEAHYACDKFKEMSPLCSQTGLYMASGHQYNSTVKHFGLQLLEETVKYKWNSISQQEKIFIKENAMKLLNMGVGPAEDLSLLHLKVALSRIVVEMVKREWPQQWTTLLAELSDACTKGEAQTELVLFVFQRLVEDVCILQTLESNQRRKDIYQALTVNMNEIFGFFLRLIELHVSAFRHSSGLNGGTKIMAHSRVVQVVLSTLTVFVEWVSITHIVAGEGRLLQILCILLNDAAFQIPAAECLSQIMNRKGQTKERKPLLCIMNEELIRCIYTAANQNNGARPEQYYLFLKKLVSVVSGISQQITYLWGKEDAIPTRPEHFSIFLETVFVLIQHASLTVCHGGSLIWNGLLKHDQISKDYVFMEYIPKVIQVIGPKVIKISYPQSRPSEVTNNAQTFASLDYDSEEEFTLFFYRCRTDLLEIFRQSTLIVPLVTFTYCEQWLNDRLQKAVTETSTTCNILDPIYLEWEALVAVLDGVLSRILLVTERPKVETGLRLLEACLDVKSSDPLIVSILLSCISALFVFLSMSSCQLTAGNCVAMTGVQLLPRVLDRIFQALVVTDPSPIETERSRAVKNLRRHAASLMVKLSVKYPLLLLPVFDQMNTTVQGLMKPLPQITKSEQNVLQESLLLISNHFCDYERQSKFIAEVISEAQGQWLELAPVLSSPQNFIRYVGLDKPPVNPIENDPNGENRYRLLQTLNAVLGVIKRCSWPDDPDRASRGGFVVGLTESGNPICRNPATSHIIPILPHVLSLMRVMNELFKKECFALLSDGYKNVFAMPEVEKKNLMGGALVYVDPMDPSVKPPHTAFDKMQTFITSVLDCCYHMMGSAGPSLGRDLYELPGISGALINSILANLDYMLPDYRLRPIIRVFFKPFVYSCPPAFYETVLLPLFAHLAPIMQQRLLTRWHYITDLYKTGQLGDEGNDDTQEVLEDMVNRVLTREYLDVLKVALVGGSITNNDANNHNNDAMDHDDHSMDAPAHGLTRAAQSAMTSEVISELGAKLLRNQSTCLPILLTILAAESWNDSLSSIKAVSLCGPVIRFLNNEQLLSSEIASNVLIAVLQALRVHGHSESNQSTLITLGVQVYEIARPKYPEVLSIMQQIPNYNANDLHKLDEKIATNATKGNKIDKAKKDLFKKITAQLIGCSIGQLFPKEIKIANLPPLQSQARNSGYINLVDSTPDPGIKNLFSPS